jgi:hypothetical protein
VMEVLLFSFVVLFIWSEWVGSFEIECSETDSFDTEEGALWWKSWYSMGILWDFEETRIQMERKERIYQCTPSNWASFSSK